MDGFKERLKELRIDKGLTFDQLSKVTGLSKSALNYWENGVRIPSAQAVVTLAKFFNVTTDYLLGLED